MRERKEAVMGAQAAVQKRINVQELHDALVYGLRTLDAMGGKSITAEFGAAQWAIEQWEAAKAAASWFGEDVGASSGAGAKWKLVRAKKKAAAQLKGAKQEIRERVGGVRQVRLELAA